MTDGRPYWERAEQVNRFAERGPDHRMLKLLGRYSNPGGTRVLDLGCAAGRNAMVLAERGFDLWALDSSRAMVDRTRERVSAVVGAAEAAQRVRVGRMDDLSAFDSATFDLVLALGVYHNARSRSEWERALAETERVLRPGGLVLVSNFSPASDPGGGGLEPLEGDAHLYAGFDAGPMYLLESAELDGEMIRWGLMPVTSTETVSVPTDPGCRVTVNGLYRKPDDGGVSGEDGSVAV